MRARTRQYHNKMFPLEIALTSGSFASASWPHELHMCVGNSVVVSKLAALRRLRKQTLRVSVEPMHVQPLLKIANASVGQIFWTVLIQGIEVAESVCSFVFIDDVSAKWPRAGACPMNSIAIGKSPFGRRRTNCFGIPRSCRFRTNAAPVNRSVVYSPRPWQCGLVY